ncbi:hypothetical protein LOD99_2900 [Oopsacas minuta]|uniref:Uncharacterized protein n=1 Tax=Oopsacas minuta TaxID=111878 RepID=A0AAV7JZE4_9METZ|nr:hypothetical protein LOD99_2900 [Oopsacas minuta]
MILFNDNYSGCNCLLYTSSYGVKSTFTICFTTVVLVQLPWMLYFIIKLVQARKLLCSLVRIQDLSEEMKNLIVKQRNQLILYKYLLTATTFELLTVTMTGINFVISVNEDKFKFNCHQYYAIAYIYVKYVLDLLNIVFFQCTLEILNLTTVFAKDVYLHNNTTDCVMRKKVKWFIARTSIVLCLALSGIGIGIGYFLAEIILFTQLICYYRNSMILYKSLIILYEDTKYEFGSLSIEARLVLRYIRHFKWFTIWFFIIAVNILLCTTLFLISLPQNILGEKCILELITQQKYTRINSTIYAEVDFAIVLLESIFYAIFVILYLPVFLVYTLYYLCEKLLFVRAYKYRYHVRYTMVDHDIQQVLV